MFKKESLPKPKLEYTRKFFPPRENISWSPKLLFYYDKGKNIAVELLKNTHTFFNMDEDKSSFLYLPSNVTSQRYVSNTMSHFKIPLAEPLNFHDPHNLEVSLSELYFPSSYYNISQDNNSNLTIQYHIKGVVHTKNITIPQGHYDPASYVKEVNKEIF